MRTGQYTAQEKRIGAADSGGIRERWLYGLRLLHDPDAMSPGGGGLRHGVSAKLVAAAQSRGLKLSEQEIRRRIQCARTYSRESQIGHAMTDFTTWFALITAGFPAYEPRPDEALADWRTQSEKASARARLMLELGGGQLALFPLDEFEPAETMIKDLIGYRDEQREITARFVERDRKRDEYLDALLAAVDGDESATWADAHLAAFGEDIT